MNRKGREVSISHFFCCNLGGNNHWCRKEKGSCDGSNFISKVKVWAQSSAALLAEEVRSVVFSLLTEFMKHRGSRMRLPAVCSHNKPTGGL